ncbi:MAG: hypothetical protein KUA37_16105 [Desulfomicrobium sp.]|nr:hypothetical protein [Pseudomonadota bacterium]MBV1713506.1 hypothetical protein [Desulfomicrobium sp.]MBU4572042.1 hypothetical protein [Pseudomonadota bacterium]MBU4594020.1 hypothetical protein [Pseudomonadota bacterium]MBV1721029.1 hypothetical protein [Desulfomicrobium sp.]
MNGHTKKHHSLCKIYRTIMQTYNKQSDAVGTN